MIELVAKKVITDNVNNNNDDDNKWLSMIAKTFS